MKKVVDIILINWNSGAMALKAVRPYLDYESDSIQCNVIIVDNGSTDNSAILLKDAGHFISSPTNLGFGRACNLAYPFCKGEYILLLNPDTESSPVVLENLVHFLEERKEYAVTGPQQRNNKGTTLRTCARFPKVGTALADLLGLSKVCPRIFTPVPVMIDWDHSKSADVDHVMGSYMLIRKSVIEQVGFMDDAYFVYFEDLDLSKRISATGFKTFYNQENSIMHAAGGTGDKAQANRLFYSINSRRIYWKKYFNPLAYFLLSFLSLTIEPVLRSIDLTIKEKALPLKVIPKAYWRYCIAIFKDSKVNLFLF